jgi:hypothetical protein
MDVFFADDSTQKSARWGMGKLVGFGGCFVEEAQLRALGEALDAVAKKFGLPRGEELKWSPHRNQWIYSNLVGEQRHACFAELLGLGRAHGVTAIVAVADPERLRVGPKEAFRQILEFVWERIEMRLERADRRGLIVADRSGGGPGDDVSFLADFMDRVSMGTEYVPRSASS